MFAEILKKKFNSFLKKFNVNFGSLVSIKLRKFYLKTYQNFELTFQTIKNKFDNFMKSNENFI